MKDKLKVPITVPYLKDTKEGDVIIIDSFSTKEIRSIQELHDFMRYNDNIGDESIKKENFRLLIVAMFKYFADFLAFTYSETGETNAN